MEKPAVAASPMPFPAPMEGIGASSTPAKRVSRLIKTKLTFTGHSRSADAGEEITLAPRLHFTSFEALKAQVEALLRSLPGAKDSSLLSLQYRDADGDLIDLLASTFDPEDFRGVPRVVLRAKAHLAKQQQQRQQLSPPPLVVVPARKKKVALAERKKAAPRRVLGRRDPNTLYAAPPLSAAVGGVRGRSGAEKKVTPRGYPGAAPAAAAAAAAVTSAPGARPSNVTTTRPTAIIKGDTAIMARHHQQLNKAGRRGGGRAPEFVFGAGESRASSSRCDGDGDGAKKATRGRGGAGAAAEPGRRRQRATNGAVSSSSRKPSWNNGNEPAWEEVRLAPRLAAPATAAPEY